MKKKNKDKGFFAFMYNLILYGLMIFGLTTVVYSAYGLIINLIDNEPVTWEIVKNGMVIAVYHAILIDAVYLFLYLFSFIVQFYFFLDDTIWRMKQKAKQKDKEGKSNAVAYIYHRK